MTERPILFSAPMIRALLAGTKTQTRRIVKPQPEWLPEVNSTRESGGLLWPIGGWGQQCGAPVKSPYGVPGDVLWVRENFRAWERPTDSRDGVVFAADDAFQLIENTPAAADRWLKCYTYDQKRRAHGSLIPAIHMPRWASRISLRITDVRVERLNEISAEDARDEGVNQHSPDVRQMWLFGATKEQRDAIYLRACIGEYEKLWDQINGEKHPWASNPWVWAVSFERA